MTRGGPGFTRATKLTLVYLGTLLCCGGRALGDGPVQGSGPPVGGASADGGSASLGGSTPSTAGATSTSDRAGSGGTAGAGNQPPSGIAGGSSTGGTAAVSSEGGAAAEGGAAGSPEPAGDPGVFDPERVYLWGTLEEGACYRDAIAPFWAPNSAQTGFSCDGPDGSALTFDAIGIRPNDERLMFIRENSTGNVQQLLAFVPDGNGLGAYPELPFQNDLVSNTNCDYVTNFFPDPSSGEVIYTCGKGCSTNGCSYYSESGPEYAVPAGYYLLHLGYGDSALLGKIGGGHAIWVVGKDPVPLTPDLTFTASATTVRATASGFWIVPTATAGEEPERWSVALDGTAASDGKFPPLAADTVYKWPATTGDWSDCAFEATGALICFAENAQNSLDDRLVRLTLGAVYGTVVYTEATFPLVKIHISRLFTGP